MMTLWLGIIVILILAGVFLVYPFVSRKSIESNQHSQSEQANIDIFRDQQRQYQQQLERSEISQQQYTAMVAEAEQLLLSNTAAVKTETGSSSGQGLWMLPVLLIIIPLATVWIYQSLGASIDEQIADKLVEQGQSVNAGQEMVWDSQLIAMISERVKQRRNNIYYWTILAQEAVSRSDMTAAANYFSRDSKDRTQRELPARAVCPGTVFCRGQSIYTAG